MEPREVLREKEEVEKEEEVEVEVGEREVEVEEGQEGLRDTGEQDMVNRFNKTLF